MLKYKLRGFCSGCVRAFLLPFHGPNGLTDGLTVLFLCAQDRVSARFLPFRELSSMAPMNQPQKSKRMLQGGGVFIRDGTVNFNNCQIYNNEVDSVSARFSVAIPWPH